ncbi:plexin-B1 isoform X2 [Tachysurus fulvidraco]|uniref:plexin-B1 isoform X2 n=1 Tax=Tachysurus fulvidraco TaxID=1234273 RepID=UPI001FED506C|nr:plexin-B1 isoform X2 [Tachysurus fulvidraco]
MALISTLLSALILGIFEKPLVFSDYPSFSSNDTVFQHLAQHPDPAVGTVYIGAQDHLYQLSGLDHLRLEVEETTGPIRDSKDCLPPVTTNNCPYARLMNNHNKLLLVEPYSLQLITCGSVHQGTCQKRSLANVSTVLFSAERPMDTQYVAANDPTVSTIGLVASPRDGAPPLLYVGRGYVKRGSLPPISTRHISTEPIFSYEEMSKLGVAGRLSEYDHNFILTFARRNYVYFLFFRRNLKSTSREYRTYIARMCLDDPAYYSYIEVPLACRSRSTGKNYNLLQGAQVGGKVDDRQALVAVFSTSLNGATKPSEESALCVYSMDEVDRWIDGTRDLCYTQDGQREGLRVAYIEYEVKSSCANLPTDTLSTYPCGSDHTPSPMASQEPVEAEAVLESLSARLTAVAVSMREGHTIAFLGDSKGSLHKVFLGSSGEVKRYSSLPIQPGSAINRDLQLDSSQRHLYIMTSNTLEKRPVAECEKHVTCQSCLEAQDPYCGWCVLEGKCGMHFDCSRGSRAGHWLWSFDMGQKCVTVESLSQSNISLGEEKNVALDIPGLPSLSEGEAYSCFFDETESAVIVQETTVTCFTPPAHKVPPIPRGQDSVSVALSLRFLNVTVAVQDFTFYDCSLVQQLSDTMPCIGCVTSRWRCNWCVHQHICSHKTTCHQGVIIYNQHDNEGSVMSEASYSCPCVERVQGSSLLPVNIVRQITLVGRNLHLFQDDDVRKGYECVLAIEGRSVVVNAFVQRDESKPFLFYITCQLQQYSYSAAVEEYNAPITVRRQGSFQLDSSQGLHITLYNCSVGRSDCSRCHTAEPRYRCVWCEGTQSSCVFNNSCRGHIQHNCPAPHIHRIEPQSGPVEGGTVITISGSNLGQRAEDIQHSVFVAGLPCIVIPTRYEISSRIVCKTTASRSKRKGHVSVEVNGGGVGKSLQEFQYQDPVLLGMLPLKGPISGGTSVIIKGRDLRTGQHNKIRILIGGVPCILTSSAKLDDEQIACVTSGSNRTGSHAVTVWFGRADRHLQDTFYHYTPDPNITKALPSKSFLSGGRVIHVSGENLNVVQDPRIRVTLSPLGPQFQGRKRRKRKSERHIDREDRLWPLKRERRIVPESLCPIDSICDVKQTEMHCVINNSTLLLCPTPALGPEARHATVTVHLLMDNLSFEFEQITGIPFTYELNPILYPLNQEDHSKPYRHKPGSIISVEGENLDLAFSAEEVVALIGDGVCAVKTLSRNHLYCEPPAQQPSVSATKKREVTHPLLEFTVRMGNLNFSLGRVQYDSLGQAFFPLEAQVGVGVGASIVALIVLVIVLIYRRKSKQALRDYKKVQIQLENLETSVRDRCKKEFTDLMTEMMDMSSDLVGSGIPFLDYRNYAERIFFPGHRESPLKRDLDVPACRRTTVEQGLVQLSNLLNSKLFLIKFIHTLESQRTFSPRDRAYVASLLTVALHEKLEYFTDILKTLLSHLVEQYTTRNPKLMLRRTESVVEKLLTNWMSICLYSFLRESAGEALYMLFRAIKHQVDKGPVDAVTSKAKYTLNDNRLLRDDVEYHILTLNVLVTSAGTHESQTVPVKVLDCDTITQVKEKILEHTWKGTSYSQRPSTDSVNLEWRAGMAGHLILSDEDLTSVVQGSWKRLNTLQHYKVPDGATVTLVSRQSKHVDHDSHDYIPGEKTPMLEDGEDEGIRLWHLEKSSEEPELSKHRRGSLRERERERAKAIPEIYLTRLLSMKGTLQKFVDDLFAVILNTSQPVPLAVKYFFDLLDDQAAQHNITDPGTIHIWKTNSLPLRFWINILKNPQFIFDVPASDSVDAVLSVIAQTFMDSCTIADHKLGRDSPINKLLYARDIPRYKQMVERYYADIKHISSSDQEMNSVLAELSRNYSSEVNHLVALNELYKYINKYYDQIISALEEDSNAQKMQLGYRLQQIAAAVENKVTDL